MKYLIIALSLFAGSALAQQPDPAFLQRAITVLQAQRNAALDAQAVAEARAAQLADDVAKLKAELEEAKKEQKK